MHRRAQNPLENCETKEDMVTAADKPDPTSVGLPTPQQVTKRTKMKKLTTKTIAFNNYGRYKERKLREEMISSTEDGNTHRGVVRGE